MQVLSCAEPHCTTALPSIMPISLTLATKEAQDDALEAAEKLDEEELHEEEEDVSTPPFPSSALSTLHAATMRKEYWLVVGSVSDWFRHMLDPLQHL